MFIHREYPRDKRVYGHVLTGVFTFLPLLIFWNTCIDNCVVILEFTLDSTNTFLPTTFQFNNRKRTSVSPPPFYRNEKAASTTFDCHCKCMESWERTNNQFFFFVADIQCACRFPKSTKRPINVQRTWFTPHALFTHYDPWLGIPYYNLTPPVPHEEDTPYYSHHLGTRCAALWVFVLRTLTSAQWIYLKTEFHIIH